MVFEVIHDMPGGWPLGLRSMNARLRAPHAILQPAATSPDRLHLRSESFLSSTSSSDLDTESTRSFFGERSMTLGRLIGIQPGDGELYFPGSAPDEELETAPMVSTSSVGIEQCETQQISCCRCVPLMVNVISGRNSSS